MQQAYCQLGFPRAILTQPSSPYLFQVVAFRPWAPTWELPGLGKQRSTYANILCAAVLAL